MGVDVKEWRVGPSIYRAAPTSGARLMSWDVQSQMAQRSVIYWPADGDDSVPMAKVRGGNPVLFPFASVCYDKGIAETWRFEGKVLPMPRHGFARQAEFELCELSENGFRSKLIPSEEAKIAYPFSYDFFVEYAFNELSLTVTFELQNHDEVKIPWSAGHHFYFTLPWHEHAIRADYELLMEFRKCAYYGLDGKLAPEKDKETAHYFKDPRLNDRIHYQLKHNRVSFGPRGGEEWTHILIGDSPRPDPGMALVTWTEADDSPFYCVEPWMGPPNSQEHGKGLHWVLPGERETFKVEISLY